MSDGRLLGDRYELAEVIGRGGMAEVRRGRDLRLGRTVAIKTLRLDMAADQTFQARFRREAQSAASLNHPAVVAVYDTGEDEVGGQRVPYIVMEHVEGRTLRDLLRDPTERITVERALEITAGILDALEYSHRAGIVHRDIKPANVMVAPNGDVKVMDFGIARALHDTGATMTQTAAVVGTAQYLSPEQARGETADARSDLYSTGCLLYELLTGRTPFVGDSLVSVAVAHVRETPDPPSVHEPSVPPEVDAIVLKALAKDRNERYQSAREMRADIERALAGRPVAAAADTGATTQLLPRPAPLLLPEDAPARPLPVEEREPEEQPARRGWVLLLAALAALVVAGIVGWLLFGGQGDPEPVQVAVPNVVGDQEAAARAELEERGFAVRIARRVQHESAPRGQVLEQEPEAGDRVPEGSTVRLVVSAGRATTTVPELEGLSISEAADRLAQAGLSLGERTEKDSTEPEGVVLSSNPEAGATVNRGTPVNVVVSSGNVTVPNVVGMLEEEATAMLENLGFDVETVPRPTDEAEPGTVIAQSPPANTSEPQGSRIVLRIAQAVEPTATPTPTPTGSPTATPEPGGSPSPTGSPAPQPGG